MDIRISVRGLVEFIMRSGDIDNRHVASSDKAMREGTRIHQKLQKSEGGSYSAEVPLFLTHKFDNDTSLLIEGRADGIYEDDGLFVIDEIKGMYTDVKRLEKPVPVHYAQAAVYAYIYLIENSLSEIGIRMTYVNLDNDEVRHLFYKKTREEITEYFLSLMTLYKKWADLRTDFTRKRDASIASLNFPFPYREGQKELVSHVYSTIYHEKKLFLEAPTGVGKTLATVFPAVMAIGQGHGDRIFYLTAKTITRTVAEETFDILRHNSLKFRTVNITAKEKICLCEREDAGAPPCNPDKCPYAKGHFDRINDAMYDCLTHEDSLTREVILDYTDRYKVCPFEFSLDLSLFADAVICDYNYVFDPHAYLRRFFAEGMKSDAIFLVDEAHNLLDRGREMYSSSLCKEDFLDLKHIVKDTLPEIAKILDSCNKEFLTLKRECSAGIETGILTGALELKLQRLFEALSKFLDDRHSPDKFAKEHEAILPFYFEINHFLLIAELCDNHYVKYSRIEEDGKFTVKLFCVDPSENLAECMARGRSTILFSATFLPVQYYKKLLGGKRDDYEVYAKSTFDPKNRRILIGKDVTSKYTSRNATEYRKFSGYISAITSAHPGNYMVFFPSHAFLHEVYSVFTEEEYDEDTMDLLVQGPVMKEEEREVFLSEFEKKRENGKSLIGFCVLGGLFAEGIDLKNDALIGAIIIGTGLPLVGDERKILRDYFEETEGDGFAYAFRYPGMNKVLQAAGRVIRTAFDRGIVALLDYRFLGKEYRSLFPLEWSDYTEVTLRSIRGEVQEFWNDVN